jgi:hypothetical protein
MLAFLLIGSCAFGQTATSDSRAQETRLVALERLWNESQVNRDSSALASLIGDHFVNTEWDGEVSERGKFLADIADPAFKVNALNIQDVKVNLYRETAVVTGSYRTKGTYQGHPYDHLGRFTDTWIFEDGRWQCVASHTSLLKK